MLLRKVACGSRRVHLQDLACVAEELVQVEDPVGDLVRSRLR